MKAQKKQHTNLMFLRFKTKTIVDFNGESRTYDQIKISVLIKSNLTSTAYRGTQKH